MVYAHLTNTYFKLIFHYFNIRLLFICSYRGIIYILNLAVDGISGTTRKASERISNADRSDNYYSWVAYVERHYYVKEYLTTTRFVRKVLSCGGGIIAARYVLQYCNITEHYNKNITN